VRRSHVPPVQGIKTLAIVNLAGKKNRPVVRACSLAKQASFFGLERVGRFLRSFCGTDRLWSYRTRQMLSKLAMENSIWTRVA
jgi:hypothetical protein